MPGRPVPGAQRMIQLPDPGEFWNRHAAREDDREQRSLVKRVHTDLVWREIETRLEGIKTVLDVGAGTGRFSIPLARKGLDVVHFDLSNEMIKIAETKALGENLVNIQFQQGTILDLSAYNNRQYDLVLCLDAPISFSYPHQIEVIKELIRITQKTLILSVACRLGNLPTWIDGDLLIAGKWKTVWKIWQDGLFQADEEVVSLHPTIIPGMYFFTPTEIRTLLEESGARVINLCAPAGLARLLKIEALEKLISIPKMYQEFLTLEQEYDREVLIGIDTAGNLLITACLE